MSYIEDKYINYISFKLSNFTKKNKVYNFKCPYCGDSQKHQNKARGYLYSIKNTYNYKCHNCGKSCSFSTFIKDIEPSYYDDYIYEKFKNKNVDRLIKVSEKSNIESKKENKVYERSLNLPTILSLDKTHFARYYLEKRMLPESILGNLYYCEKFKEWTNTQKNTFKNIKVDEPRIIIPLTYKNNIFGFQGRSLNKNSKAKYITIILDENLPKVYGLDTIDWSKNIYVTEGPIDSMFLDNCIAMVGADVNINTIPNNDKVDFIFVYDNEKRNKEIISRMEKVISEGHSIVIWPANLKYKDINDMIMAGLNPNEIIKNNTFRGLEAKAKLIGWKRI